MNSFFDIGTVAKLSGLSIAMVDYLCRTKIVVPTCKLRGRGRKRLYTFPQIIVLRVISKLLGAGVSVSKLGKAIKGLKKFHPEITPNTLPGLYLVTNGAEIYFRRKDEVLECLSNGQLSFAFVIEIEAVKNEIIKNEEYIAVA